MVAARHATFGLFLVLAAIWGMSFVATRATLPDIPPVILAALRFMIAGSLMLGYAISTTAAWFPTSRDDWLNITAGGLLFVALHHAFLFTGQQYVTSAVAAVVISLDPILASGFARVFLPDETLSWVGAVGLLLGLLGVGIIANPSLSALLQSDVIGVGLVFLAAAAFALGAVITERSRTELPVQTMQAWMMLVGTPILFVAAFLLPNENVSAITWSWSAVAGLSYLSVIAAGVGYLIYFELLDRLGSIEINLIGYVAPMFATIGGWLILHEGIQVRTIAGFGVIVVGFILLKRKALRTELEHLRL